MLIRQRLRDGRLPRNKVIELGYGSGVGQACDGCGATIDPHQRLTVRISADDWRTLRLHDDCAQMWELERSATADDTSW